jgi:hypothetical protein
MAKINHPAAKGCAIAAALIVGVPLLVVAVVGVQTWAPLHEAGQALDELDRSLGDRSVYVPAPSGEIPAERMELFLELRASLVSACEDYGTVRKGFDSVAALETKESGDLNDVGDVAKDLGGASLSITPFLARFFKQRNDALLAVSMGLSEYSYIFAVAYHDNIQSPQTFDEIFSNGEAVSPAASLELKGCLARQLVAAGQAEGNNYFLAVLEEELWKMEEDPGRLIWQDGLPEAVAASVRPHREQLDRLFCGATAGLEMERDAGRALWLAIE